MNHSSRIDGMPHRLGLVRFEQEYKSFPLSRINDYSCNHVIFGLNLVSLVSCLGNAIVVVGKKMITHVHYLLGTRMSVSTWKMSTHVLMNLLVEFSSTTTKHPLDES